MLFNYAVQFILSNFFWSLIKQVFQSIPLIFDISPLPLLYPPPCLRFLHSSHPCCRYLQTEFSKYRDPQFSIPRGGETPESPMQGRTPKSPMPEGVSTIPHTKGEGTSNSPHTGETSQSPLPGGGTPQSPMQGGDSRIPLDRGETYCIPHIQGNGDASDP